MEINKDRVEHQEKNKSEHGPANNSATDQVRYSFPDKRERKDGPGGENA
ncbi:hypothetical protein [Lachnotalea sp. AF33-28]|jgi:hypothetical protein|nr:hypothetical protein [Lachnotalea sp. AF33-28]